MLPDASLAPPALRPRGTRSVCPALERAEALAARPLSETPGRWQIAAWTRGAAASLGLSAAELRLLALLVDLTWDQDWGPESEPVVPVPLAELAEALGRSERQVRNLERGLMEKGLLVWRDAGNHRRAGRRDRRTGLLTRASGPSLAPLRARAAELRERAAAARAGRAEGRRLRLGLAGLRRRIRAEIAARLAEGQDGAAAWAAFAALPARFPAGLPPAALAAALAAHRALLMRLAPEAAAAGISGLEEISVRPETENRGEEAMNGPCPGPQGAAPESGPGPDKRPAKRSALPGNRQEPPDAVGKTDPAAGIALPLALRAAGPMLAALLPPGPADWAGFAMAAERLRPLTAIDRPLWEAARADLGPRAAALALVLTERGLAREAAPGARSGPAPVRSPGAYFRCLARRGRAGRLDLAGALRALARRQAGPGREGSG